MHYLVKALLDGLGAKPRGARPPSADSADVANLGLLSGVASAPPEVVASMAELRRLGEERLAAMARTMH